MRRIFSMKKYPTIILLTFLIIMLSFPISAEESMWLAVGSLQNWFSAGGCEVEVGRRHETADQQDGFQYPALYPSQDMQAAKGLWFGSKNYDDPVAEKVFNYKVVHVGPRVLNETSEFIPQDFTLYGKFDHPEVVVNGTPGSQTVYRDLNVVVDETLPTDRMLSNVVNTSMGITMTRKIYYNTQQFHDNYFIYDFEFENTGIYDINKNEAPQDSFLFIS